MSLLSSEIVVEVWWSDPTELEDASRFEAALLHLDDDERARARRLRPPKARAAYVAAHGLLRSMLAQELGKFGLKVAPSAVVIVHDRHGAPHLGSEHDGLVSLAHDLRFSLTHTDGLVACAVVRSRDVGIDAEHVDRGVLVGELAARTLTERERETLEGRDEAGKAAGFLALFTMKEAFTKARGLGLALDMSTIELRREGERLLFADAPDDWHLEMLALGDEHQVALAVERRRGDVLHVVTRRR